MQLTYRGRIIVYNIAIFLAVFSFIVFCVVQGTIFLTIDHARDSLKVMGQDASLYIEENLKKSPDTTNLDKLYAKNADLFTAEISSVDDCQTLLYGPDRKLLSNSSQSAVDFSAEFNAMGNDTSPVITATAISGYSALQYLSPVVIDDTVLGYVGFIYALEEMDAILNTCLLFLFIGAFFGIPILIVITLSFSNHFIQPVRELTTISEEINKGNYNVQIHYRREDEIGDLTQAFNAMTQNINNVIIQLDSERRRLASVLASIDDGLLALDKNGNVLTVNSYIKTYFNVVNPKTIYDFQFQSFLRDMFDDLKNGKSHISEEIDCNDRNLLIIGSPISGASLEENYMIVIRNITATKQFRKEQQKFISSVSHELRTPLTTIIGYTDMLTRRQVVDHAILERSLLTINREGHRLLRLVDDLLNVNQFDRAEFDVKKTNVDLHSLLVDVVEQMEIKSHQNDIDIVYKSDEHLPEIFGDYDRLQQLFINVLHNAIKYSDTGDIIDVVSTLNDDNIVVSIRDYGVGISDIEQQKIFSAFYRVEEDRARSIGEGGAGLGLYLVKQIVDKHNGSIAIESFVGEGTNIIVTLPILAKSVKEGTINE